LLPAIDIETIAEKPESAQKWNQPKNKQNEVKECAFHISWQPNFIARLGQASRQ
jgi:hypothetical protein